MKKYSLVLLVVLGLLNLSLGILLGFYGSKLDDQSTELDKQVSQALTVDARIKEKNEKFFEFVQSKNAEFAAIHDAAKFVIQGGSWGIFLGLVMAVINTAFCGVFLLGLAAKAKGVPAVKGDQCSRL